MSDQAIAVAPPTADAITIDVGTEQVRGAGHLQGCTAFADA